MSFFWPIAAGSTLLTLLGGMGKDEGEEAQSELTDVQEELAKLMLEQYKSRFANEEQYMPEALKTTFDYTRQTLNRPRNVVWGKGIFEPTLQPRQTYDIKTPEWNTFTPSPDLPPPSVDTAPGPVNPGGGGGVNPGQESPGGGTGPANMPPGLGVVSPGSVHTDDPSDGLAVGPSGAAVWPMTPHMADDSNKVAGPANWNPMAFGGVPSMGEDTQVAGPANMGPSYPGSVPSISDDPSNTYNPNAGNMMALFQNIKKDLSAGGGPANMGPTYGGSPAISDDPTGGLYDPSLGNQMAGAQMPRTDLVGSAYNPANQAMMAAAQMPKTLKTGQEGQGYTPGGYMPAMVGPTLKTGDEGQGYSAGGYHPSMVAPTLRTGQEGQGYSAGGYTPSMVGPTLRTGQEGQGYSPAMNPGTFALPSLPTTIDQTAAVDPTIAQGLTQLNGLGKEELERRVAAAGGLPPGLFFMPNGMLGFSGGSASVNAMVGEWLANISRTSNAPPQLGNSQGNEAGAFSPDPAIRYGVNQTPPATGGVNGSGYNTAGQRLPTPTPLRPDGTPATKDDQDYKKSTGLWPWEVQAAGTGTPTPPKKVRR